MYCMPCIASKKFVIRLSPGNPFTLGNFSDDNSSDLFFPTK